MNKKRRPMVFDCGPLKNKYTDNAGLLVSDEDVRRILNKLCLTKDKVIDFLGRVYCERAGAVWHFLLTLEAQSDFYKKRILQV